jgi:hypothetical protein
MAYPHELASPTGKRRVKHHREARGVARVTDQSAKYVGGHVAFSLSREVPVREPDTFELAPLELTSDTSAVVF